MAEALSVAASVAGLLTLADVITREGFKLGEGLEFIKGVKVTWE
jgi:hypothetical protein